MKFLKYFKILRKKSTKKINIIKYDYNKKDEIEKNNK